MSKDGKPYELRVVIVGGGVAGLVLANALEQAGVDYVLLERRHEFAPQVGASIGLCANGLRILDQLGVHDVIEERTEPITCFICRDSSGKTLARDQSTVLGKARTGYDILWGDRQVFLQAIYENIKDKSRLLVDKTLVDIEHNDDGVVAVCGDGSRHPGDILIGADGVFSKTREKLWQLAERDIPDVVQKDKKAIFAINRCCFGIATGLNEIGPGETHLTMADNRCSALIGTKSGRTYYFIAETLEPLHGLENIPRYTRQDEEEYMRRHGDLVVLPGRITVADAWKKTISSRLVPVEEAKFSLWTWGRIACAGDSVHKSTPNLGMGGNAAIESAAVLANGIRRLAFECRAKGSPPTRVEVEHILKAYQEKRQYRAESVVDASGQLAQLQTLRGIKERLFARFVLPHLGENMIDRTGESVIGAEKLDYLPIKRVSLVGTSPFNASQGEGRHESKLWRAFLALPLVALSFGMLRAVQVDTALPWARALRDSGKVPVDWKGETVPILRSFYGIAAMDDLLAEINTFFLPSVYSYDPAGRRQILSFITDATVVLIMWMVESVRRANNMTLMQYPCFFAFLSQFLGGGFVGPLYAYIHYVFSPIELFGPRDRRLTHRNWTLAAFPAAILCCLLPIYASYLWPRDPAVRQLFLFGWQLYPIPLAVSFWLFSKFTKDTTDDDRLYATERDLPAVRFSVGTASALAAVVWIWTMWVGGAEAGGMWNIFVPSKLRMETHEDLAAFASDFLRYDQFFMLGGALLWELYLFWDLRVAGMLSEGLLWVIGVGLASLFAVGPGATLGLGFLWREHILATRRHKDALTLESIRRLHGIWEQS